MLHVSLHLHGELSGVTAFSASHYHLLPLFSLPPNPCKSKPGLNSRSLICFSTRTSPTKVRRSDVVLHFCSQTGLIHGMLHQELSSKRGRCFNSFWQIWELAALFCRCFIPVYISWSSVTSIYYQWTWHKYRERHFPKHLPDQITCITSEN